MSPKHTAKLKSHLTGTHYQRGRSIGVTLKNKIEVSDDFKNAIEVLNIKK